MNHNNHAASADQKNTNNLPAFVFTPENDKKAKLIIAKYPQGREKSAVLPLLDLAQRQNNGWLSNNVIEYIANYISEPFIRVYEIASFYTMYNLKPVGKYHIQVCGTTPCWLRGADKILKACEKNTHAKCGTTSDDNLFTVSEVECLGACIDAPVVQINDDYYENLTPEQVQSIIQNIQNSNQSNGIKAKATKPKLDKANLNNAAATHKSQLDKAKTKKSKAAQKSQLDKPKIAK